jgi:hypothetical protein
MSERQQIDYSEPLVARLSKEAVRLKKEAHRLKPGKRRQELLRKARKADVAASIYCWVTSPGLQPPE